MSSFLSLVLLTSYAVLFSCSEGSTVNCDGTKECEKQSLKHDIVECNGYYGCRDAKITDNIYTFANGYYAISKGSVKALYALYANGFKSAAETTISAETVVAYGNSATYGASIKTSTINSYGYHSSEYAEISPKDGHLDVNFFGYYSGYHANIICSDGDNCMVHCEVGTNGCAESNLFCLEGAKCKCECPNGANCPTMYEPHDKKSRVHLNDTQLKAIYHEKVAENKKRMRAEKGEMIDPVLDVYVGVVPAQSEDKTCSYGLESVVVAALVGALIATFLALIVGYRWGVKQRKYSEFTQLMN